MPGRRLEVLVNCPDVDRVIDAYTDDELGAAEAAGVRAHLDACPACRDRVAARASLSRLIRRVPYYSAPDRLRVAVFGLVGDGARWVAELVGAASDIISVATPEALRFLQIPDAVAANLRQIIYALLIVGLMRYRPQGLRGAYQFD